MPLNLDIDIGDSIIIGDSRVTLERKTGRKARLSIDADKSLDVSLVPASSPHNRGDKREQFKA